jgi:hypothetical protein
MRETQITPAAAPGRAAITALGKQTLGLTFPRGSGRDRDILAKRKQIVSEMKQQFIRRLNTA